MTFKIISLNLWHGGELLPAILDFLKREDADIVALQEVYGGDDPELAAQYRSLQALAPLGYPHQDFAPAYLEKRREGMIKQGNAVLSKFPIAGRSQRFLFESTLPYYVDEVEYFPILPRVLQGVKLDSPAGELNIYNLHGVWDLDGDNYSPERRKMAEIILDEIGDRKNVVLLGDSNANAGNPFAADIGRRLGNVFEDNLKSTFNMRRKTDPGYATAAVDIMYVSSELEVLERACPDVDVSDHLPLTAILRLP